MCVHFQTPQHSRLATSYGLDGPLIESRLRDIFLSRPDWSWDSPSLLESE